MALNANVYNMPQITVTNLVITKKGKQPLTKFQQEFNTLTARIEKLQSDFDKKRLHYDKAMQVFSLDYLPKKNILLHNKLIFFKSLWQTYKTKNFSVSDKNVLKELVKSKAEELFQNLKLEEIDAEMKLIYEQLFNINFNEIEENEKNSEFDYVKKILKKEGIKIKRDEFDDEEKLNEKFTEFHQKRVLNNETQQEADAHYKNTYTKKNKTKKEVDYEKMQEEIAAAKQKNISTIYKQLAKLFHPDLEVDETRKAEKEILMKELIAAYQSKNLHAILLLEMKWLKKETTHLESITDDKLSIYIEVLREQVKELKIQIGDLAFEPQYNALAREFEKASNSGMLALVQKQTAQISDEILMYEYQLSKLVNDKGNSVAKKLIKEFKSYIQEQAFDEELFEIMYNNHFSRKK